MRVNDLDKSTSIILDNPLIGIGIDATKANYSTTTDVYQRGLPHNLYLKDWAELGLVGFAGYVIWLIFFFKKLRHGFFNLPRIDQIWMIIFIPFFTMLIFLDLSTTANFMLALMTGMFYFWNVKDNPVSTTLRGFLRPKMKM